MERKKVWSTPEQVIELAREMGRTAAREGVDKPAAPAPLNLWAEWSRLNAKDIHPLLVFDHNTKTYHCVIIGNDKSSHIEAEHVDPAEAFRLALAAMEEG